MAKKRGHRAFRRIPAGIPAYFPITISAARSKTKVVPNRVVISVPQKDEVVWHGAGDFIVDFNGDTPFAVSVFIGGPGRPAYSGPPVPGRPYKDYKYTAKISGATLVDPIIHTDP